MATNKYAVPVCKNSIKIKAGSSASTLETIKNVEEISMSFDKQTQEWFSFDQGGFGQSMSTGQKLSFDIKAKRIYGDPVHDYIAGLAFLIGEDCYTEMEWVFPNGDKIEMTVDVQVSNIAGGSTTDIDSLEFTCVCQGKPTYTPNPSV